MPLLAPVINQDVIVWYRWEIVRLRKCTMKARGVFVEGYIVWLPCPATYATCHLTNARSIRRIHLTNLFPISVVLSEWPNQEQKATIDTTGTIRSIFPPHYLHLGGLNDISPSIQ